MTCRAKLMGKSRRGLDIAASAASVARILPTPVPRPMIPVPASFITVRMSAKSRLTIPALRMISVTPTTPWRRMSSATRKASVTGVFSGTIRRSLSLETMMSVSTTSRSFSIPSRACFILLRPSNAKGFVTTPTVRQPQVFLAMSAMTGAAPVPVPPPIPAVMNIMSAPEHMCSTSLTFSMAAALPTLGSPPAPRPRVNCLPMLSVFGA
mmetsp:Transcript_1814/g.4809  ORF Transcript_1814/g.4809 Transcript_1814/m.4809 type:complete len:209 (-) Transcript_1814:357-983(-)